MDVEAVTDEIPSNALSCSPLDWNFQPTGRILRIFYPCGSCEIIERQNIWNPSSDEIRNVLEEPESENEEKYFQASDEELESGNTYLFVNKYFDGCFL